MNEHKINSTPTWIPTIGRIGSAPQAHFGGKKATQQLISKAQIHDGQKILVLGCGSGTTAIYIGNLYRCEIIATDINPIAIKMAQKSWDRVKKDSKGHIEFVVDDIFFSHLPSAGFDRIIIESVLIMLPKCPTLQIIHNFLTPAGLLAINEGICIDAQYNALREVEIEFQKKQIEWSLPSESEWQMIFYETHFKVKEKIGPIPVSIIQMGISNFFNSPWQTMKLGWKIIAHKEPRRFFRTILHRFKVARIKWGFTLWICQKEEM